MRILFLLTMSVLSIFANPFEKRVNEICVDYPKQITKLSFKQLCHYGKHGCKNIGKRNDIQVLCNENTISECFSQKKWLTIEQFTNLDDNEKITKINTRTTIVATNGLAVKVKQLCVETAKKTFNMSKEKFKLFKQLAPAVLDTINKGTKDIISCIEGDISEKNLNKCMQEINKTTEETIAGLIPSKAPLLCEKDKNNKTHFEWSKKKHLMLIKELKNKINENNINKRCLLKSDTPEQYAACLAKKS